MPRKAQGLAIALMIAVMSAGAWGAPAGKSKAPAAKPKAAAKVGGGFALARHLKQAEAYFSKKQWQAAAMEMQRAAKLIRAHAAQAAGADKKTLEASAAQLERIAKQAAKTDAKAMRRAFAHAHYAMASYQHHAATAAWSKKDKAKTGMRLQAAAANLEHAATWAGHKMSGAAAAGVKDARAVAQRLASGADVAAKDVDKALRAVGTEIEALGKKVK